MAFSKLFKDNFFCKESSNIDWYFPIIINARWLPLQKKKVQAAKEEDLLYLLWYSVYVICSKMNALFQEALSLKCDSHCTDRQSQTVIENKPLLLFSVNHWESLVIV